MPETPARRDAKPGFTAKRDAETELKTKGTRQPPPALENLEALERWHRMAIALSHEGYGDFYFDSLDRYAMAYQDWLEVQTKITPATYVVKIRGGEPVQNPFLVVRDEAARRMSEAADQLPVGLNGQIRPRAVTMADYLAHV
jgi:hypothetical protein